MVIIMSINRKDYIILGFDLTPYMDKIYTEEWCTDENVEKWECNKSEGHIQLFSDLMHGSYLYFGYIVSAQNKYDKYKTVKINLGDADELDINEKYDLILDNLINSNLFSLPLKNIVSDDKVPFEVICFTELDS